MAKSRLKAQAKGHSAPEGEENAGLPLLGIRVLELGHIVAGPFGSLLLADLGAEVIKVENPKGGDQTRRPGLDSRAHFVVLNRNKKSVTLDLQSPGGRDAFLKLVRTSDVVLENYGPGVVERLGVDYKTVARVNPGIIYCSIKGFLPGPYSHKPLTDEMAQMMGGLAAMTGTPENPVRAGCSIVDMGAGTYGVVAILAALLQRERTGRGQHILVGLFDSVVFWMARDMMYFALSGRPAEPFPLRGMALRLRWEVYDRFRTSDGKQTVIGVTSDKHWRALCLGFGLEDWLEDSRLGDRDKRIDARDWLLPRIQEVVGGYTQAQLVELLDKLGIPTAPVYSPEDLYQDPYLSSCDRLLPIEVDEGQVKTPILPIVSSAYRLGVGGPPPNLGEHTEEVLGEVAALP